MHSDQMVLENGITNDPERVGFYSGLIESIFAFTSFLSSESIIFVIPARFPTFIFQSHAVFVFV